VLTQMARPQHQSNCGCPLQQDRLTAAGLICTSGPDSGNGMLSTPLRWAGL